MKNNNKYISFDVIKSAIKKDPLAIDEIFKFYSGYIYTLSCMKDGHIDEDLRYFIEIKLLEAILKFDIERAKRDEKN